MSYMKIWGCEVYVKRQISTKLEPKSDKCLFVGYPKETRGYYFYNPSEGKVFVARTGVFLEKDFISKGTSGRKVELEEIQESQSIDTPMEELEQETQVVVEEQPAQVEQDQRRSSMIHHLPERYGYLITDQGDVLLMDQDEPVTYSWNLRLDETVKLYGFIKNEDEPCVYKKVSGSMIVFLVLYVDDILLIGNDVPTLQQVKSWLGKCFSMKDLGEAAYILGIRIYRDRS